MEQTGPAHSGEPNPLDNSGLCLLSLDGGGVRGLSTLYILKGLMDRLNKAQDAPRKKPCDVFDLIGGTSTGGLIAIMLGRLEMDVDECITAYIQLMKKIFRNPSKWSLAVSLFGHIQPRFDASKLEDAINEVITSRGANPTDLFNNQAERGCRVFVCSMTQQTKGIVRLRSYPGPKSLDIPATILEAARATAAATSFFEPVSIGARRFVDGALGANNPVDEVEGEASDIWCPETELKPLVKCFISIGTGNPGKKAMEDRLLRLISKTLPELVTETEKTEKNFIARWRQHYDNKRYYRFNVEQGLQDVGLEEYQEQGLIEAATEEYLDHQAVTFRVRDCIQNLQSKQSRAPVDLAHNINEYAEHLQEKKMFQRQWLERTRWHVPFDRNPRFIGRQKMLDDIHQKVQQHTHTSKIAVIGLGGMGKTQLVLELAHRVREDYGVFWVPVNSWANVQAAYYAVARSLRLPGCATNGAHVLEEVQKYLSDESIGPWLLIFDNADDIDLWTSPPSAEPGVKRLIDYMPRSKLGSIIWTTRDRKVAITVAQENTMTVPEMDEAGASEASKMMRKYLVHPDQIKDSETVLPRLLQKLTYLPLAIVQAAAYINETGISLTEYDALFSQQDEGVMELLSEEFEDNNRYRDVENAVATTWLISFAQIRRRNSLAFDYLGLMACVDPKDIPRSLLPLSEGSSRKQQTDAISILNAFSFITRHEDGSAFDMHRLVHLATRGCLKRSGELSACHKKAVMRLDELLSDVSHTNRTTWRVYIAHAQCAVLGESNGSGDVVGLAKKCADCLHYEGRYREAEIMHRRVLEHQEKVLGPEHPDTVASNNNLARALFYQSKYKEAEIIHQQVLQGKEKVLGLRHSETLNSASYLASVLSSQGKYKQAEAMHQQVLKRSLRGPKHPDTLSSISWIGYLLFIQGQYNEAEIILQQVLQDQEKVLGHEHPETFTSISTLGLILFTRGKYKEAETMHRQALQGNEKVTGPEHPITLSSANNLGLTLIWQGKYEEAEAIHQRALAVCQRTLGPEALHTLTSLSCLGEALTGQGMFKEAETIHRRALQGKEKILGPKHPSTLASFNNLGLALLRQGKHEEAETMHQRALGGWQEVLGPEALETFVCLGFLGDALAGQGKFKEAEIRHRQAIQGEERILGPKHPVTVNSYNGLGLALSRQGKYKEAEVMCRQALEGLRMLVGPEDPRTLMAIKNLSDLVDIQGKYKEAKPKHRRPLPSIDDARVQVQQAIGRIWSVYDLWGCNTNRFGAWGRQRSKKR